MPFPLLTPRVNNNDDVVRLTKLWVDTGASIRPGLPVADIETDKSVFTIEAEREGYLLGFLAKEGDTIAVGSILAWIGSDPSEAIPSAAPSGNGLRQGAGGISLKAGLLLAQYGLKVSEVPHQGGRLTAGDVESYVLSRGLEPRAPATAGSLAGVALKKAAQPPSAPGKRIKLTPEQRGMLKTVEWPQQEAAPAYVEISYDAAPWEAAAREFQKLNKLLVSPLVSLMSWRLVQLAREHPEINATLVDGERYVYDQVNLGFTVQAGERLYVVVLQDAGKLNQLDFVKRLGELQRSATNNSLRPDETAGATIALSSMARWPVTRHVPILVPHTAMMIAHTGAVSGNATLGATYDHRVLSGADAVRVLQALSRVEGMA
jgi:pyruvate/2-oxoglutarate dehydrogenase complex dihydrolipoamide acyltransferase (E2) component